MTEFIVAENLPFMFAEKLGFTNYCRKALNPQARGFSRKTIRRESERQYNNNKIM